MDRILGPADIGINAYNPATQFTPPEQSSAASPSPVSRPASVRGANIAEVE
ncbi:hypothetical protein C7S16_5276 [Burkholderia thailandensis]|uniref:Uncharacterized protein n=1 Tax=Burkholderia thailandensis TaxID=57975 RepID=A0AAW9CP93_BURTH|nr:hypothetical protein [Burkholderia thailandensis]